MGQDPAATTDDPTSYGHLLPLGVPEGLVLYPPGLDIQGFAFTGAVTPPTMPGPARNSEDSHNRSGGSEPLHYTGVHPLKKPEQHRPSSWTFKTMTGPSTDSTT
ncbi:Hypothetical predicted protein [Pelobates cultripes]|uniref:Uncharacterized protein n=1 Tax=Pelobates cultripes TaxID=61616 RepID=A0AAD1SZ41_PELCU|nr:Hypothetical predicted protein [Pelobates cultripes]